MAAVASVACALAGGAAVAASAASQARASARSPNPGPLTNHLYGVSATSGSDAWAVGDFQNASNNYQTLTEHWNGTTWTLKNSPDPSSTSNHLRGVSATSVSNAWAVGYYDKAAATDTLAEQWNGTTKTWKKFASPDPSSTSNSLYGVSAISASSAWAVGDYHNNTTGATDTLVLRWNGTTKTWKQMSSPNGSLGAQDPNHLYGVSATSAANVWAVGDYVTSTNTDRSLILHWNGAKWTLYSPMPSRLTNELYGVSAISASDALAVGYYSSSNPPPTDTLALHWNGKTWSRPDTPQVTVCPSCAPAR